MPIRRNNDSPASRAFAKVRELDKAKKPKKLYAYKLGNCVKCEVRAILEPHHIYRRSLRPDLVNDPQNIAYLCHSCHRGVTENRVAEEALQDERYPSPPSFKAKNDLNL